MDGFYLMYRGWLLHPALDERQYCHRAAWAYLIDRASHRKRRHLDRGQLAASCQQLATEWGWTKSRAERFLKTLQKGSMIRVETRGRKPSIITICNYDKYQTPKPAEPPPIEAHMATLARHERDQGETPYNQLNQNKNNLDKRDALNEADRRMLEELLVILFGLVDKSAIHTKLGDISGIRRRIEHRLTRRAPKAQVPSSSTTPARASTSRTIQIGPRQAERDSVMSFEIVNNDYSIALLGRTLRLV